MPVLARLPTFGLCPRLTLICAGGGHRGRLVASIGRLRRKLGWRLEIVKRTGDVKGVVVLPER